MNGFENWVETQVRRGMFGSVVQEYLDGDKTIFQVCRNKKLGEVFVENFDIKMRW